MPEERASAIVSALRSNADTMILPEDTDVLLLDLGALCLTTRKLLTDLGWPYRVSTAGLISWMPSNHDEIWRASMIIDDPMGAANPKVAFGDVMILLRAAFYQAGSDGHSAIASAVLESLMEGKWPGLSSEDTEIN